MELIYTQNLINCQRQELLTLLKKQVSKKRFEHILRVEETGIHLAQRYSVDVEKASIAALLHDYAKDMDEKEMLYLAEQYWSEPLLTTGVGEIWHGFAAAQIAKDQFQLKDSSILTAIAGHTIGWYEMDTLFKVIFIADYTEQGRDFPGVEKARKLAKTSLDDAVTFKMIQTIKHLIDEKQVIFLPTVDIYNQWISSQK